MSVSVFEFVFEGLRFVVAQRRRVAGDCARLTEQKGMRHLGLHRRGMAVTEI